MTPPAKSPRPFMTFAEVAELLLLHPSTFCQKLPEMITGMDFPEPMPHRARPYIWRRDRVEAWIAAQGLPRSQSTTAPPAPAGANVILLDLARTA